MTTRDRIVVETQNVTPIESFMIVLFPPEGSRLPPQGWLYTSKAGHTEVRSSDVKISFIPFFCKALVAAFRQFPQVNANMDEATHDLIVKGDVNIGIAAATEDGLTVPVVMCWSRSSPTATVVGPTNFARP